MYMTYLKGVFVKWFLVGHMKYYLFVYLGYRLLNHTVSNGCHSTKGVYVSLYVGLVAWEFRLVRGHSTIVFFWNVHYPFSAW